MPNRIVAAQMCDATADDSSNAAGNIIVKRLLRPDPSASSDSVLAMYLRSMQQIIECVPNFSEGNNFISHIAICDIFSILWP